MRTGTSNGAARPSKLALLYTPAVGFDLRGWRNLLRENNFEVDPAYYPKAALSTLISVPNTIVGRREQRLYGAEVAGTRVEAPLFVLGHARSGTTFLRRLLALDDRFACNNAYQTYRPHVFLLTEARRAKMIARFLPATRPMDNMPLSVDAPVEDELAMVFLARMSPVLAGWFPRNRAHYRRYLSFRDVPPHEIARWKSAFMWFLQKLTFKYGRRLLLKSPQHTARIRLLLELFPDAKFVHIHRDPYTVYQSTYRLFSIISHWREFQHDDDPVSEDRILRHYTQMFDAFFEDKPLIPPGQFHEVRFEDLERDPFGQVSQVYEALGLDGFARFEPKLRQHVESLKGYRKNTHRELDPALKGRIVTEWRRSFDEWGYAP